MSATSTPASWVSDLCLSAWAAGLFEGEGSVSLMRTNRKTQPSQAGRPADYQYPSADLQMADADVMQRFADVVGMGRVFEAKPRPNRKQLYRWTVTGADKVGTLFVMLRPWLGERRIRQFTAVMEATHGRIEQEVAP